MPSPDEKQAPRRLQTPPVEPVPAAKLTLFDSKNRSSPKLDEATKNAGNLMRDILGEEGRFAFCVRPDTGHVLVGYADDGHAYIFKEYDVGQAEKKFWSVGGVMDGQNAEYSNIGTVPGWTMEEVFERSNAALRSAGLAPEIGFTTPKLIEQAKRQRGKLETRGITPGGLAIPQSSKLELDCVWEGAYAYTGWYIQNGFVSGQSGTRLNHDRLTGPLSVIGGYEVFNSVERVSHGDRGEYLEATYQNIVDNSEGNPVNRVSAGSTYKPGTMYTRAKAKDKEVPACFYSIQRAFKATTSEQVTEKTPK